MPSVRCAAERSGRTSLYAIGAIAAIGGTAMVIAYAGPTGSPMQASAVAGPDTAMLRIEPLPQTLLFEVEPQEDFDTYHRTLAHLLKSRFVITSALKELQLSEGALSEVDDPAAWIEGRLVVEFPEKTIIRVSLRDEQSRRSGGSNYQCSRLGISEGSRRSGARSPN